MVFHCYACYWSVQLLSVVLSLQLVLNHQNLVPVIRLQPHLSSEFASDITCVHPLLNRDQHLRFLSLPFLTTIWPFPMIIYAIAFRGYFGFTTPLKVESLMENMKKQLSWNCPCEVGTTTHESLILHFELQVGQCHCSTFEVAWARMLICYCESDAKLMILIFLLVLWEVGHCCLNLFTRQAIRCWAWEGQH